MPVKISDLLVLDIKKCLEVIDLPGPFNELNTACLDRQYTLLNALLPVVFFCEAKGIVIHPRELTQLNLLIALTTNIVNTYRFSGSMACRRFLQFLATLPGYDKSLAGSDSNKCCELFNLIVSSSKYLIESSKSQSSRSPDACFVYWDV